MSHMSQALSLDLLYIFKRFTKNSFIMCTPHYYISNHRTQMSIQ